MTLTTFIKKSFVKIQQFLTSSPSYGRFILYRNIREYWEKRGGDRYFLEQESRHDRTMTSEYLAKEISSLNGKRILEVGCGYGKNLKCLRALTDAELVGIDFSKSQLLKANEYLAGLPGISLLCGGADALPFPDSSFDVVFTSNVIIHNAPREAERIRSEIIRVSKKYIVHKEDTNKSYSRYGYDHTNIYREMGFTILRSEKVGVAVDAEITQFTIAEKPAVSLR